MQDDGYSEKERGEGACVCGCTLARELDDDCSCASLNESQPYRHR
jgi:hypothetical protein